MLITKENMMSWEEAPDLGAENTVKLGGRNKNTGKPNPTSIEGYYLGKEVRPDKLRKGGFCNVYAFQTAEGIKGVYGTTNLDKKMSNNSIAVIGRLMNITFTGMTETKTGPMYTYRVRSNPADTQNVTPIGDRSSEALQASDDSDTDNFDESIGVDVEDDSENEVTIAPKKNTRASVEALLNKNKN